jgi:hypothetical protein
MSHWLLLYRAMASSLLISSNDRWQQRILARPRYVLNSAQTFDPGVSQFSKRVSAISSFN